MIKKIIKNLKKNGLIKTLKKFKEKIFKKKTKTIIDDALHSTVDNELTKKIQEILNDKLYDRIILWRSPFGWKVPLFQRPQHISRGFAQKNSLILYEITDKTDAVETLQKQEEGIYLVNFENYNLNQILFNELKKSKLPKYIQLYSTNWSMELEELKKYQKEGFKILYEYIDDISPELSGTEEVPKSILEKYNYIMSNDNTLLVVTANELQKDAITKRGYKNLVFSCNGVDYNHFQNIDKNYNYEKEFLDIINNGKLNICYYGALAKWFDYELIKKISETNKYNVILFGVKYDESYCDSKIEKYKNIYFLGARDYSVLKNYANKADILIIPFLINDITQATSPLKLFEYMALHKPIVTTAMNECKKYESVLIGDNHEEFLNNLEKAKKLINNKNYINLLDKEARENTWDKKAEAIIEKMKEIEKGDK